MWDRRLNAAYVASQKRIDAGQRDPLRAAQRLWIQCRDATCRFYGLEEGTIRRVQATGCLRALTEARSLELEAAMRME